MNIYIDESGTFVTRENRGALNAVGAYAVPENSRKDLEKLIRNLKISKNSFSKEIKSRDLTEDEHLNLIKNLTKLNGIVFCILTDASLNSTEEVSEHMKKQSEKLLFHINKMKYESGRKAVQDLDAQLKLLPPQLCTQLILQINLMHKVVSNIIPYFIQRNPAALTELRWRIDQKDIKKTRYEEVFEKLCPALLQTKSITDPIIMIEGYDYSCMSNYEFPDQKAPEYLREEYGLEVAEGFDLQKLIRANMKFVDSKDFIGVQAIDLILSAIRKCLKKEFSDNEKAAYLLGKLMIQAPYNRPPINFLSFGISSTLDSESSKLVKIMTKNCNPMIHN